MLRKFNYFASASLITTLLMGSASYAVHEAELTDVINSFKTRKKVEREGRLGDEGAQASAAAPISDAGKAAAEVGTLDTAYVWGGYLVETVYWAGSKTGSGVGHTLRYTGDCVRSKDSKFAAAATTQVLKVARSQTLSGYSAEEAVDLVESDGSFITSLRNVVGNSLRTCGGVLAGESETLARKVREFWLGKAGETNEEIFASTACSLFLAAEIYGPREIRSSYNQFADAWGRTSHTGDIPNEAEIHHYFLKGIVRGFAKAPFMFDGETVTRETFSDYIREAYDINILSLPSVAEITAATLIPDETERKGTTPAALEQKLQVAHNTKYQGLVAALFKIEERQEAASMRRKAALEALNTAGRRSEEGAAPAVVTSTTDAGEGALLEKSDDVASAETTAS